MRPTRLTVLLAVAVFLAASLGGYTAYAAFVDTERVSASFGADVPDPAPSPPVSADAQSTPTTLAPTGTPISETATPTPTGTPISETATSTPTPTSVPATTG